ncbi:MAG: hypothetical protein KF791_19075 [Verrucomicrobiae bacterium]|nr:hypothetical protein [Verrucomicrobiae bacterium]
MAVELEAVLAALAGIEPKAFSIAGVFALEAGLDDSGAVVVRIWAEDAAPVKAALRAGLLPDQLRTAEGSVPLLVETGRVELWQAHTARERPMRPGASIGRQAAPRNAGTYGARVVAGGAPRGITAGHVLGRRNSIVTQPGRRDQANAQRIGTVAANPYRVGPAGRRHDVALVAPDKAADVDPSPHDSPQPSPANPAVGLLLAGVVEAGPAGLPQRVLYMDVAHALAQVEAAMPQAGSVAQAAVNDRVEGSGRTSGPIRATVAARGIFAAPGGARFPGFSCRPPAGARGDSGAVVTRKTEGRGKVQTPRRVIRKPG